MKNKRNGRKAWQHVKIIIDFFFGKLSNLNAFLICFYVNIQSFIIKLRAIYMIETYSIMFKISI